MAEVSLACLLQATMQDITCPASHQSFSAELLRRAGSVQGR